MQKEMMVLIKGKGYVWGLSSVILAGLFLSFPFLMALITAVSGVKVFDVLAVQISFIVLPLVTFVVAFIGKVRSEHGTKARKLCNIGAAISWSELVVLSFSGFAALWTDVLPMPAVAADITIWVDTILLCGYFLIAYLTGKLLWYV